MLKKSAAHAALCSAACACSFEKSHGWNEPAAHSEQLLSARPSAPATH